MQRDELRQQQQRNTLVRSHKIAFDNENEGDPNAPTKTTRGFAGGESHPAPNTPNGINNNTSGFTAPRSKRPRTAGSPGEREAVSPTYNGGKLVEEHSARSRIRNTHHEASSEEDHDDGDDEASPQQNRFGSSISAPSYKHKRAAGSPSASTADSDLYDKHRHHHRQHHNYHHQTHNTSKRDSSNAHKNRSLSEDMDDDSNGQQESIRAHRNSLPVAPETAPNHITAASAASAVAAAAAAAVLNRAKQTAMLSSSSSSASSQQNPISRRQQQRQQQLLELKMQQQQNSLPLSDRALSLLETASSAIPAVEWTNNSENAHCRSSTETPMALLNRQYYRHSTSRSRGGMSGDQSGAGSEVADLESSSSRSQISSAASLPGVQSNANTTSAERVSASNRDDDAADDAADRDGSNSSDSAASIGRPNESGGEASQNQVPFSSSSSTGDSSSSGSNDDSRKSTGQKTGSSAGSGYCKTAVSNSDETEEESIAGMNIDCSDSDRLALCEICRICEVDWAIDTDAQSSTTGWPEAFREFKEIREGTMFCFFKSNVWDVVRTSRSFRQAVVSLQLGVLELSANQNDLEWVAEPFSVAMQRDRRATVVLGRAAYRLLMKTEDTFKVIPRILTLVEMYFGALSRSLVSPSMPWPRFRVATEMTIYEEAVMTNLNLGTSNAIPSSTRAP